MASTSVSNDDFERDLTCGICMEYYDVGVRTPKMLECRHVFCSSCLNVKNLENILNLEMNYFKMSF